MRVTAPVALVVLLSSACLDPVGVGVPQVPDGYPSLDGTTGAHAVWTSDAAHDAEAEGGVAATSGLDTLVIAADGVTLTLTFPSGLDAGDTATTAADATSALVIEAVAGEPARSNLGGGSATVIVDATDGEAVAGASGRIVAGSFTGTVCAAADDCVEITDGRFSAYDLRSL